MVWVRVRVRISVRVRVVVALVRGYVQGKFGVRVRLWLGWG